GTGSNLEKTTISGVKKSTNSTCRPLPTTLLPSVDIELLRSKSTKPWRLLFKPKL
ncbi:hypothetical protein LINPERPRIM_LOCUS6906, partial [Linum perenne]